MNKAMAAKPTRDKINATTTRASALRRMTSMNVAIHKAAGANTERVAQDRKRKSPSQLVGRPTRSVNNGHSAITSKTTLAHNACVGVTKRASSGCGFRSRLGKNDARDFMVRASRLTTQAQRPGPRGRAIATTARWPGSLQRLVRPRRSQINDHNFQAK